MIERSLLMEMMAFFFYNRIVNKKTRERVMMKLKKFMVMLSFLAAVGVVFTGCSKIEAPIKTKGNESTRETTPGSDVKGESNQKISGTITIFEHEYSYEDSLKKVIDGFHEIYPNVDVKYEIKAGQEYYSILSTAIQSGDGPIGIL